MGLNRGLDFRLADTLASLICTKENINGVPYYGNMQPLEQFWHRNNKELCYHINFYRDFYHQESFHWRLILPYMNILYIIFKVYNL